MTNKKLSYWELRAIQEEEQLKQDSIKVEATVRNAYLKAQKYLTAEVRKIYQRYLNKTDKTEAEVKQILNTSVEPAELVKLKQLTKDITNPQLKTESQNYLTGLAVKHRITRLEDLKAKSYLVSKQVANVQLDKQTDFYIDTIHKAYNNAAVESIIGHAESGVKAINDGKYKSWAVQDGKLVHELIDSESGKVLDTIKVTKNEPVTEFKELSTKYVRNILDNHWQGSNYSKRIWNDTELLAKRLEELFTVEAMTGMSEQDMAKAISKEFETSIYVSRRLIRTEANYMVNQAKLKSWLAHGVDKYSIVAVLDFKTSEICQHQDGKIYKVKDAVVSVNYPPLHVFCRSVARAIFSDKSLSGNRIAIDRVTGKTMTIKQSTTYKEWEKMLLAKHGEKELELAKTKVKNYRFDLAEYNKLTDKYKKKHDIKSFDNYQEYKYKKSK
ncbi:minor capsid protein [Vagococcus fluvialis]|uniref:minor capsid protein n=1 Tax=Vagococcus fluvialis TaxID=2738 RepID=UPI001A8E4F0C|nr:minor capsid protein [Vagococcus fluvialis]MBO0442828.1 minor capsid protein [Vagococcus fluvialis]